MRRELDAAYQMLQDQARQLCQRLEDEQSELLDLMAGKRTIPHGVASTGAAALASFEKIRESLRSVNQSADRVSVLLDEAIANHPVG